LQPTAAILQATRPPCYASLMNWDDLRIVAAVRDAGTYAGASAHLRIDETTVGRRLARIERTLGIRLFEAVDGLRRPTAECEIVVAHVRAMAGHVAEIGRVAESRIGLSGRFRIASTNAVAEEILSPHLTRLLSTHPGLTVQPYLQRERQIFALAGRSRHPPAQAGQGRLHHRQARRVPPLSDRARGCRGRASGLCLSGRARSDSGIAISRNARIAGTGALRRR
jgi:Bacterial regulatory helix-turn-helix protein, lysR family